MIVGKKLYVDAVGLEFDNWIYYYRNGRPQPDNREGRETCLGVLKNVYQDGVVFHDISCHHKKPVICEQ